MAMTSRELVYATIECDAPERLVYAIHIDKALFADRFSPEQMAELDRRVKRVPRDFVEVSLTPERVELHRLDEHGGRHFLDEWGVEWTGRMPRVVGHPLGSGWDLLDGYTAPGPPDAVCIEKAQRTAEEARGASAYVLGSVWFTLFERMWFLRGFENLLVDAHVYPGEFERLRQMVVEFQLSKIRALGEIGVDGIYFSDDWGTQDGLIISPEDWRRFYRPAYERLFRAAHEAADHVWMHQCGNVAALVPEFVELGLDVLNPIQPRALDVEWLGREWRGRLCFCGGIDVQHTLPFGTPNDVRREIEYLIRTLSAPSGGGYIPEHSHTIGPETPFENLIAMFDCLERLSRADAR